MNFRKVNNLTGWAVFLIASFVYILTTEKSGSLWDTGEFIAAAYKVQMPHPPGAPLFVLLGRFFIILFGDSGDTAAKAVNIMNALASGFTVLFLFWTITHFARKLVTGFREEPVGGQIFTIIGAGIVGALAYTFTDSFWYSAVEGEVYALSSFFTALAFWAVLKWERADEAAGDSVELRNRADRWIVFLFFSLGLSIGVHLLGLLIIPAAAMIYYYRRYNYTRRGAIFAFIIGIVITGIVQVVVIQWSIKIAGWFDLQFVNGFGLPFFSGFTFFFILVALLIFLGLRYAAKKQYSYLRLGLWCFTFMLLGYSAYITTMERSNANPSVDMNNVDNPQSLVSYLGRDQYGSQPILMGPHFIARRTGEKEGKMRYAKGDNEYVEIGRDIEPTYAPEDIQVFPRIWDGSNDQNHADYYMSWLQMPVIQARELSIVADVSEDGLTIQTQNQAGKPDTYVLDDNYRSRVQRGQVLQPGTVIAAKVPSFGDNLQWFFSYQMGFMYWRYFMWNFSGKQNDIQGGGNIRDGNWITGISMMDDMRLGDQDKLPSELQDHKSNNKLFLLPFILGVLGCVFQLYANRRDWVVTFLLFFMTGIAIIIYLNQAGNQPRERDYAFTSSFYAFAIWIGLAVVAAVQMARDWVTNRKLVTNVIISGAIATTVVMFLSDVNHMNGGAFIAAVLGGGLFAAVSAGLTFLAKGLGRTNLRTAALAVTAACLLVPAVMAAEEWDDHDRSKKTLAPDLARDYLMSCPPNAILFTFGDNDTYPLWYAQEVEGVRPDIRILNTSLLGIDWYVNQLRYKINESAPVDVIWSKDQLRGLQYIVFNQRGDQERYYPLYDVMKNVVGPQLPGTPTNPATFPVRKFTIPVNVSDLGPLNPGDSVGTEIRIDLPESKNFMTLDQMTILNILAANGFKRPICFTSPYNETGFGPYLRQEGMIYRLVPQRQEGRSINLERTDSLLMNVFKFGNAGSKGLYFDEENRRHLLTIRQTYAMAAASMADAGKRQDAVELLERAEKGIDTTNLPYAMTSRFQSHNQIAVIYLEAAMKAGHTALANRIKGSLIKNINEQKAYINYLKAEKPDYAGAFAGDEEDLDRYMQYLNSMDRIYNPAGGAIQERPDTGRRDSGSR